MNFSNNTITDASKANSFLHRRSEIVLIRFRLKQYGTFILLIVDERLQARYMKFHIDYCLGDEWITTLEIVNISFPRAMILGIITRYFQSILNTDS